LIEISICIANAVELLPLVIEPIAIAINPMTQPTAEHRDHKESESLGIG
jgi:hypothetical protein